MAIKLLITAVQAGEHCTVNTLELDSSSITIGSELGDSVKLDPRKLQACRARISRQQNTGSGPVLLTLKNLSTTSPIYVNQIPLQHGEETMIDNERNFRMGEYLISAAAPDEPQPVQADEFSLDSAIESLLRPLDEPFNADNTLEAPAPIKTAQKISQPAMVDKLPAATKIQTVKPWSVPQAQVPTQPTDVAADRNGKDSPAPQTRAEAPLGPNNPVVEFPEKAMESVIAEVEQTLFECKVGVRDIQQLDFDALRLYSISGRVCHHENPLAGIELDGGELGRVVSDAKGCFRFDNIVEGTHFQIDVKHDGYLLDGKDALCGVLTESVEIRLSATKLSRVSGRLTYKGQPLPGIRLDAGSFGHCISDENGYYHFDDIPENTDLTLTASQSGYTFKQKNASAKHEGKDKPAERPLSGSPVTNKEATSTREAYRQPVTSALYKQAVA
ncbi:MAG: hypothetical protein KDJ38_14955 [Gammaproteobacteria bacterium]|nr:hypothetical protein [Gammaproteobacteria bacterium]